MEQLEIYKNSLEDFHDFTLELLSLLNNVSEKRDLIKEILYKIKEFTDLDAVGIRLKDGEDYPYYEAKGFNEEFIMNENTLCSIDNEGKMKKDNDCKPLLECMCGIIIRGRTDSSEDFFSDSGSFWINKSSNIDQKYLRNKFSIPFRFTCINRGYQSVALIPIYSDTEIIGLLQLNNNKVDSFNQEIIKKFEKIANIIGVIFKRKALEKKIIEQEAKFAYNELQTKFFSKISHEFRTPISLIFSVLKMIDLHTENHIEGKNKEKIKKYLGILRKNNNRILKLVNNLIDIMEIDTCSYKLQMVNVDIVKLIAETVSHVQSYINGKRKLEFHTDLKKKKITCDPDKIERVLLNLLSNAIKFSAKDDKIKISIFNDINQEYLFISVKDTGIGIKEEIKKEIFDKLNQVDDSFSRNNEGLGVGLTIVKEIVKMHNGEIILESEYGKGSEFIIKIPDKKISDKNSNQANYIYNDIDNLEVEFADIYEI